MLINLRGVRNIRIWLKTELEKNKSSAQNKRENGAVVLERAQYSWAGCEETDKNHREVEECLLTALHSVST